jgi:hypothetical protein
MRLNGSLLIPRPLARGAYNLGIVLHKSRAMAVPFGSKRHLQLFRVFPRHTPQINTAMLHSMEGNYFKRRIFILYYGAALDLLDYCFLEGRRRENRSGTSGTGSASSPFGFLAARGKVYAALVLFNRLIAGPSGRSASQ